MDQHVPVIHVECDENQDESVSSGHTGSESDQNKQQDEKQKNRKQFTHLPRPQRRDSGSSVGDDDEITTLTDEMKEKIKVQAEYYFSDENLKKDGFLLKHVKRNKEGYVNLKLLASFKKMRSLNRDYRVIGEALKDSTKLVVNETGLKLRRVEPLPKELLEQARVKHVVLSQIPRENPSMTYITEAFSKHKDDVVSVRIVKPGKKYPNDLQSHFSRHPELRDEIVAVVEFDNPDVASEVINATFTGDYKEIHVKLLELGPKQVKRERMDGETASDTPVDSDASTGSVTKKTNKKKKSINRFLEVSGKEDSYSSYGSSSDSEFSSFNSCSKRHNRSYGNSPVSSPNINRRTDSDNNSANSSPRGSPLSSPNASPKFNKKNFSDKSHVKNGHKISPLVNQSSPHSSPDMRRKKSAGYNNNNTSAGQSAWMLKRMQLNNGKDFESESTRAGNNKLLDIVRQPKGPDGSIGFSNSSFKKYVLVHAF